MIFIYPHPLKEIVRQDSGLCGNEIPIFADLEANEANFFVKFQIMRWNIRSYLDYWKDISLQTKAADAEMTRAGVAAPRQPA
ncbi:MAG TPA: hypothetical protein VNQ78_03740 [Paracoccus sp. (in: a-proteobacteria)]|uniref:hypothetical protein n=1 Tax=Paracoccus sp. TaxID=267 RepID=UPI002C0137D7|nr:hypothetical protein [Paracoccus sp. (in: a-proteobacteria)]HWL55770.1 hypothetical protein [Paracoccus sp. (in: a-proteobacteria)]